MKIIKPTKVSDTVLVRSTVPEPDATDGALWNATTSYVAGALVYLGHRQYRAIAASTGRDPRVAGTEAAPAVWVDLGPTNRWAAFDDVVGTQTVGASPLTVVLRPGATSGLALLKLVGRAARVTMRDRSGGAVVYDRDVDLDGTLIDSIYDWFFAEFEPLTDVVLTDLPGSFTSCELTVTVTATSGQAAIGVCSPGQLIELGDTLAGASVGILDYSRKERDAFGRTTVLERAYSKRASFSVDVERASFNRVYRTLAGLRATPCIYIGSEDAGLAPLLIYGFYKDFSIDVQYPTHHLCSLQVEGLI